jgi:hypothetical protein
LSPKEQLLAIGIFGALIEVVFFIRDVRRGQTRPLLGSSVFVRSEAPRRFWIALLTSNLAYLVILGLVVVSGLRARG